MTPLLSLFWKGAVNGFFVYFFCVNILPSFSQFHAWVGLEDGNVFECLVALEVFCITRTSPVPDTRNPSLFRDITTDSRSAYEYCPVEPIYI